MVFLDSSSRAAGFWHTSTRHGKNNLKGCLVLYYRVRTVRCRTKYGMAAFPPYVGLVGSCQLCPVLCNHQRDCGCCCGVYPCRGKHRRRHTIALSTRRVQDDGSQRCTHPGPARLETCVFLANKKAVFRAACGMRRAVVSADDAVYLGAWLAVR
ncbi:uncharacterized protein BDZ83DRAFT_797135 [Colletotrichum acutatum]|uniref:Uncharacterized protein n=1 Tax=Glomerella acutata TaxID=27357 RepID=A0AAD8X8W9_GLOAC|nr:uncharacterized protein BDZ83DRAFT_797135 [Colletotrichum acutatum]KAK1710354.1 hypothetical protein BDZ83DRAFT_797135 [Colletotrichum acutatum]